MKWLRDGRTVYALEHAGWDRGREQFQNRWSFHVQRGPNTPEAECEEIAALAQSAPETAAELERAREDIAELVEVLTELADLMDDVANHEYEPDSFTTQPARLALAKHARAETSDAG